MNERTLQDELESFAPHEVERNIVQAALAELRARFSLDGQVLEVEPAQLDRYRPDAVVEFSHAEGRIRYIVECKTVVDRKLVIDRVQHQFGDQQGLLVAPYISRELAEHCRDVGVQFLDTCGNAYLRAAGLLVYIAGEKNEPRFPSFRAPKGLTNPTGLRVVFALLSEPALIQAPLKTIAAYAGVSVGGAYNVLEDLEGRGYLLNRGSAKRRRLLDAAPLIEEWAINYPTTLRSKLHARRFHAPDPQWWKDCMLERPHDITWSGEVAARALTKYLKPGTQTLYVPQDRMEHTIKTLVGHYRLRPDPAGEVEVLEKFWMPDPAKIEELAPALLVYSELLGLLDPRAKETAHMIKERYIEPTFDTA